MSSTEQCTPQRGGRNSTATTNDSRSGMMTNISEYGRDILEPVVDKKSGQSARPGHDEKPAKRRCGAPVSVLEWGAAERHAVNRSWCTGWGASSTYSRNARVTAKVGCHMGAKEIQQRENES